jgi:hypothetical protein
MAARKRVWDLTSWTKPRPMSTVSHIKDRDGHTVHSFDHLVRSCADQFYSEQDRPIDLSIVDTLEKGNERTFPPLSLQEMREALANTSAHSAPGPDHLTWSMIKQIFLDSNIEEYFLRLFNTCIAHSFWSSQFKTSITIVIPKPKKPDYAALKAYRPIVLLSCLGKLFEKMIVRRMQYYCTRFQLLHPFTMWRCQPPLDRRYRPPSGSPPARSTSTWLTLHMLGHGHSAVLPLGQPPATSSHPQAARLLLTTMWPRRVISGRSQHAIQVVRQIVGPSRLASRRRTRILSIPSFLGVGYYSGPFHYFGPFACSFG